MKKLIKYISTNIDILSEKLNDSNKLGNRISHINGFLTIVIWDAFSTFSISVTFLENAIFEYKYTNLKPKSYISLEKYLIYLKDLINNRNPKLWKN